MNYRIKIHILKVWIDVDIKTLLPSRNKLIKYEIYWLSKWKI